VNSHSESDNTSPLITRSIYPALPLDTFRGANV
jgi:hypothetical protein